MYRAIDQHGQPRERGAAAGIGQDVQAARTASAGSVPSSVPRAAVQGAVEPAAHLGEERARLRNRARHAGFAGVRGAWGVRPRPARGVRGADPRRAAHSRANAGKIVLCRRPLPNSQDTASAAGSATADAAATGAAAGRRDPGRRARTGYVQQPGDRLHDRPHRPGPGHRPRPGQCQHGADHRGRPAARRADRRVTAATRPLDLAPGSTAASSTSTPTPPCSRRQSKASGGISYSA